MSNFKITTDLREFHVEARDIYSALNTAAILVLDHESVLAVEEDRTMPLFVIVEVR